MKEKGQSIFELVIALAVTMLIVTGIVQVVTISIRNANFAKTQAEATRYAQQAAEWLRAERNKNWELFYSRATTPLPTGDWCLKNLDWTGSGVCRTSDLTSDFITGTRFLRDLKLELTSPPDSKTVKAEIRVSWTDSQGKHESKIDTVLVNTRTTR